MDIIPQATIVCQETGPSQINTERADILASGDHEAFLAAMNAQADREALLKQVSYD